MSRVELVLVEHGPLVEQGPEALRRADELPLDVEPLRALVGRLLALPWEPDEARLAEVRARIERLEARGAPPQVLEPQRRTLAALRGDGRDPARVQGASPHELRRWLVEHAVHLRAGWDLDRAPALLLWLLDPAWRAGARGEPGSPLAQALRGAHPAPAVLRAPAGDRYNPPPVVAAAADALGRVDPAGWEREAPALAALAPGARPEGASGDPARDLAWARGHLATLRAVYARAGRTGQGVLLRLR